MRTILTVYLVAVLLATPARGHSTLVRADPQPNSTVARVVVVRAWFREELDVRRSLLRVTDAAGRKVDKGNGGVDLHDMNRNSMRAAVRPLGPGRYTVMWRTVSAEDGHSEQGRYVFVVRP
jgi:methionine-rich copper-binding protein CopC